MTTLDRAIILSAIRAELEPLPYVIAMWEGGAAAFNRIDAWSDIDLQIDVLDAQADSVVPAVERALSALSPIELQLRMPPSIFELHVQMFYRLRDAGPFLLIDLSVLKHSQQEKYLQPEIHGTPLVHFDKAGVVKPAPIDRAAWQAKLDERVAQLRVTFPMFQSLTRKELNRGNSIEAIAFYFSYTLRPLLELLRIKHAPFRYSFATRYVHYDLPAEVVARLQPLYFVASPEELATKHAAAEDWFNTLLAA